MIHNFKPSSHGNDCLDNALIRLVVRLNSEAEEETSFVFSEFFYLIIWIIKDDEKISKKTVTTLNAHRLDVENSKSCWDFWGYSIIAKQLHEAIQQLSLPENFLTHQNFKTVCLLDNYFNRVNFSHIQISNASRHRQKKGQTKFIQVCNGINFYEMLKKLANIIMTKNYHLQSA